MLKKTTTTTWIPSVKNTLLLVNVNHHLIRQGRHKSSSCTKKKKITVSAKHNKAKHKKRKNVYFASSIQYNDQEKNSESKADRLKRKNLKCLAWHMTSPALSCAVLITQSLRPRGLQPARLLCPWDSPGKNTGVGCYALLQGIFLTQGSNPRLLCCRWTVYRLSHQGKPQIMLTGLKQNLLKLMSLSITPAKKLNTLKTQLPLQGRKTSFSFQAFWLA